MFANFANIFSNPKTPNNNIFVFLTIRVARRGFCLYLCTLNKSDKRKEGYFIKVMKINEL